MTTSNSIFYWRFFSCITCMPPGRTLLFLDELELAGLRLGSTRLGLSYPQSAGIAIQLSRNLKHSTHGLPHVQTSIDTHTHGTAHTDVHKRASTCTQTHTCAHTNTTDARQAHRRPALPCRLTSCPSSSIFWMMGCPAQLPAWASNPPPGVLPAAATLAAPPPLARPAPSPAPAGLLAGAEAIRLVSCPAPEPRATLETLLTGWREAGAGPPTGPPSSTSSMHSISWCTPCCSTPCATSPTCWRSLTRIVRARAMKLRGHARAGEGEGPGRAVLLGSLA